MIDLFVDYVMTRFRRNSTIRELSLDKALEIAVAMETATKDAIELRNVQGDTFIKCGVTAENEFRHDQSRSKRPDWFVIVVMELTIWQINADLRRVHIRAACRSGGQKKKPPT